MTLRRVGDVQIFGAMYHIPAVHHADLPALEVLADALVAAPSGRLYKALVETKKVAGVSSNAGISHDPGIFEVAADVRKDRSLDEVRDEVLKIIEGVKEDPLTKEEVERSKDRILKNIEQNAADPNRLAVELGQWSALGDWRLYFLHRDRLEKVTPEQIKEAAEKYFRASNRTTGVFTPTDKADRTPIPAAPEVAGLVDGYKGRDASGAGEAFDTDLEAIQRRVITPEPIGGVKLAFLPKKNRGETVSLSMTLRYGNAESLKGLTEAAVVPPATDAPRDEVAQPPADPGQARPEPRRLESHRLDRLARRPARDPAQVPPRGARPAPPDPPRAHAASRPARDPQDRKTCRLRVVQDRPPVALVDQAPADHQPLFQG